MKSLTDLRPAKRDKEPEARAAVASWALAEARHEDDLSRKRAALERARTQLLTSLRLVEADLERISA